MGFGPTAPPGGPLDSGPQIPLPFPAGGSSPGVDPTAVATGINSAFGYATNILTYLKAFFSAIFGALTNTLGAFFSALINWLRQLKDTWIGQIITGMWRRVSTIWTSVKDIVLRVQKVLRQIRQIQDYYYQKFFVPIFDLIQRLRRVLLVFRIFHLKLAQRLDADLANIEQRLAKVILDTRGEINRILNYLNLIIDPLGMFNLGMYIRSAAQSIGALIVLIDHAQVRDLTASEKAAQEHDAHQLDQQQVNERTTSVLATGTSADFKAHIEAIQKELSAMGYH